MRAGSQAHAIAAQLRDEWLQESLAETVYVITTLGPSDAPAIKRVDCMNHGAWRLAWWPTPA